MFSYHLFIAMVTLTWRDTWLQLWGLLVKETAENYKVELQNTS
jgi:hypothetical protein